MRAGSRQAWFLVLLALLAAGILAAVEGGDAQEADAPPLITGRVVDPQREPILDATVVLVPGGSASPQLTAITQENGRFSLPVHSALPRGSHLVIERPHYQTHREALTGSILENLRAGQSVNLPTVQMERNITAAFWLAAAIFLLVLVIIAFGLLHNTLAALLGAALLFALSYLGPLLHEGLYVFGFRDSLRYVDWNVIFLIMGMMIVIAVIENTGLFQWLAFFAYRISGGRAFFLLPILMLFTGLASAFLDNVTTMLLMTPITVQIALALEINPLALLMPEVLASNVIGVSTLVGTPTNILIGSFGSISFNEFLRNLTPGVLMAFLGLVLYAGLSYRKELSGATSVSPMLLDKLEERGTITEPGQLRKAGVVGGGMLALFLLGESFHLLPAVTALMGATALLVWIRPDVEQMIEAVDWTTLVFFIALFMVVGGIQEVGLIGILAGYIGRWVGGSLLLSMLAVTWLSAVFSMLVANIPFTAAMLPVIRFLTGAVPGAGNKALYYCLSVGAAMGGNGSLIGASANMVTAGIADSAGYPLTYGYFLRKGLPALLITVGLASIWLLLRFL